MSSGRRGGNGRHTTGVTTSPWRRVILIAVIAGLAAGWFLVRGGSESGLEAPTIPADALAAGVPDGGAAAAQPSKAPVETIEVFASKDPFEALVVNASGNSSGGLVVKLVSVSGKSGVEVSVDGTEYDTKLGETFAHSFELVSTNGDCASVLYGDDQFSLCEGEQIVK